MKTIILYIIVMVMAVGVVFYVLLYTPDNTTIEIPETTTLAETTTETTTSSEIVLSFTGDATLGTYIGQYGGGRFDEVYAANTPEYFFANVKDIFDNDDLTVVNLEGPLTNSQNIVSKEFSISGPPEYVKILTSGSVDTVNLANNHTLDRGEEGLAETKNILKENNIGYFGNEDIYYAEIKGVKFGIIGHLGYQDTQYIRNSLKTKIDTAKANGDIVIVEFHWGIESQYTSYSVQENLAHYAIDNGVDLVVASHPHVIQGIETYNGKNIVYSMGNFCFGANKNPADKACFIFQQSYDSITKTAISSKVIPCNITSDITRNNYQPTPLEGADAENVINRLKDYSSKYAVPYAF